MLDDWTAERAVFLPCVSHVHRAANNSVWGVSALMGSVLSRWRGCCFDDTVWLWRQVQTGSCSNRSLIPHCRSRADLWSIKDFRITSSWNCPDVDSPVPNWSSENHRWSDRGMLSDIRWKLFKTVETKSTQDWHWRNSKTSKTCILKIL